MEAWRDLEKSVLLSGVNKYIGAALSRAEILGVDGGILEVPFNDRVRANRFCLNWHATIAQHIRKSPGLSIRQIRYSWTGGSFTVPLTTRRRPKSQATKKGHH